MKILIISSDLKMNTVLKFILSFNKFTVEVATSMTAARKALTEIKFNLVLLDIHNQETNAFDFIKEQRELGRTMPVLYLGERAYEHALIRGTTGTKEFLLKPFSFQDLKAKVNDLISGRAAEEIQIDPGSRAFAFRDQLVYLGRLEMKILMYMSKKAGKVVSSDKIRAYLEKEEGKLNMTVYYYVSALRSKLEQISENNLSIQVVRGGYQLVIS